VYAILCVASDRNINQTISHVLRARGYICISAESAEEAVGAFGGSGADLVIVDHTMEGSEKLAEDLKKIRNTPIIMLAGLSDILPTMPFIDLLCPKPINAHEILREVDSFLKARRQATGD